MTTTPPPLTLPGSFPPPTPRGRPSHSTTTTSIQSRRSLVSLGLGVSFAPFPPGSGGPDFVSLPPTSSSGEGSKTHSRGSSISTRTSSTTSLLLDLDSTPTPTVPSRRPSLTHLASFLSGIEHHTRVRSTGASGGRGVSRSASRSQSRAGGARSHSHSSRRGSVDYGSGSGLGGSTGSLWDLEEGVTPGRCESLLGAMVRKEEEGKKRTYTPLMSPRVLGVEKEEEDFLETAPSSPVPLHLSYNQYSSHQPSHRYPTARQRSEDSSLFGFGSSHSGGGGGGGGTEGVEVFVTGERVGVGVWLEGRGGWARDCFPDGGCPGNGLGGPGELEVVRRLGEGTYAIVYLVREVLYSPSLAEEDDLSLLSPLSDSTPFFSPSSFSPPDSKRPTFHSWGSDPFLPAAQPTYGRNFALKCLCKKDLSQELVEVQRGEAVLHRGLPDHEFIVRLYGAFETDDWLFLVLEYCPGQDLYYWLDERADDSEALYDFQSRATSPFQDSRRRPSTASSDEELLSKTITSSTAHPELLDSTPPSPSLLSSTANSSLLSRKRLRLISRMFGQMCSAVAACHNVGISHRDIKPENFIVMDGRESGERGRVVVKITDWGLGTREVECEDFDCGSKPYMAYECRNNLNPSYDPRQADVWSLGLVLLNLLFHRNPWADPSLTDPDFAAYVKDPKGFLQDRFEGIGDEVAGFLSEKVFCDVEEDDGKGGRRKRVSAAEFGRWAGRLVVMMGEGKRKRASVSDHTFHLVSSVARPDAAIVAAARAATPSLLSQYAPTSHSSTHSSPTSHHLLDDLPADLKEELPKVDERDELVYSPESLSSLPLPLFPDPDQSASTTIAKVPSPKPSPLRTISHHLDEDDDPLPSPSFPSDNESSSPQRPPLEQRQSSSNISGTSGDDQSHGDEEGNGGASGSGGDMRCWGESESTNSKSKRRKRGARKGRSGRLPGDTSPPTPSPLSPGSPLSLSTVDEIHDQTLANLTATSQGLQDLAREISKATVRPSRSMGTQSASDLRLYSSTSGSSKTGGKSSTPSISDLKKPAKPGGGVFGRMKGLVMDGNQDLNALKQRAQERNASFGAKADTYSAPAKMQGRGSAMSGGSYDSRGSVGSWSAHDAEESPRGRSGGGDLSPDHWSSASSRRERQQRIRHGDFSPASSTRNGTTLSTSSFDSRTHTPLSSFSSVASHEISHTLPGSVATVRDWRQPSPHPRPFSTSRPPPTSRGTDESQTSTATLSSPPKLAPSLLPPPILVPSKPKLKDAATDTIDLGLTTKPSLPVFPPPQAPIAVPLSAPIAIPSKSSTSSSRVDPAHVEPPAKSNKLAKMLNSISVFNRSQERSG